MTTIVLGMGYFAAMLLAAPYRQRNEARAYISRFHDDHRMLEVSLSDPRTDEVGPRWLGLKVTNPNHRPVDRCYGKLVSYVAPPTIPSSFPLPRAGHKFPWTTHGGAHRLEVTIASRSSDILDIAVAFGPTLQERQIGFPGVFYTPEDNFDPQGKPILSNFPLPVGLYEAAIEVGSSALPIPLNLVRLQIDFKGGTDLGACFV